MWVFVGLLYALLVIGVAIAQFPDRERIDDYWAHRVVMTIEEAVTAELGVGVAKVRDNENLKGKSDLEIAEYFAAKESFEVSRDGFKSGRRINASQLLKEHNAKRARDLDALPAERAKFIGWAFLAWIVPLAAIYLLGAMTAWVIKGFRNNG